MSLRTRLFLTFAALTLVLLTAQWLLIRVLSGRITEAFGQAAVSVSRDLTVQLAEAHGVWYAYDFNESDGGSPVAGLTTADKKRIVPRSAKPVIRETAPNQVIFQTPPQSGTQGSSTTIYQFETSLKSKVNSVEEPLIMARLSENIDSDVDIFNGRGEVSVSSDAENVEVRVKSVDGSPLLRHSLTLRLDHPRNAKFLILESPEKSSRIELPRKRVSETVQEFYTAQLTGSLLIFLAGLAAAAWMANRESRPLRSLAEAARSVGGGSYGVLARHSGGGWEMKQAVEAFNWMSRRLLVLDKEAVRSRERRALAELGEVARGLAHSLRNPLNTLGLSLEQLGALAGNHVDSGAYVEQARNQISRIDSWIRSFLSLASDGAGEPEPVDLETLARDVVLEAIQCGHSEARVEWNLPGKVPQFLGIPAEIRAVLQTLVVNAVEASPANGLVTLDIRPEDVLVRVTITDEGPGLADQVRQRLFQPHVTTKPAGAGMGLFLAHRIVSARYRGRLVLENAETGGTAAVLELPLENDYGSCQGSAG